MSDKTPDKVKVYKKQNDTQPSFCGELVQTDEAGKEFFELPDHLKEQASTNNNLIWPETAETPEAAPAAEEKEAE